MNEEKHGYFQLFPKADGTYIKVYNPENGGSAVTYNNVAVYLHNNYFSEVNAKAINNAIVNANGTDLSKISDVPIQSISEYLDFYMAEDRMGAYLKLTPPCGSGSQISRSDVIMMLNKNAVKKGILEEEIDNLLKERDYTKLYLVAKGQQPIEGHSAKIEYEFDAHKINKPKTFEDGTVDFKNLDLINHVKKGDLLATYTPVFLGEMGYDVIGAVIRPKPVRNFSFRIGKNVYLSEDKHQAFAGADGHVVIEDNKTVVHDTYFIEGDVDVSVGNIDFVGSVRVSGSVRAGYEIKSTGDIEVMGIVEGARLIAGGSIILSKGIQGMNRGVLDAKGNIIARFIESTKVRTGGSLHTDSILHSIVYASGEINCTGKKGLISGGDLRSGTMITAKVIGSNMGTSTSLEVGLDPMIIERFNKLSKQLPETENELNKIHQVITFLNRKMQTGKLEPDKVVLLQKSTQNKIILATQLKELQTEYETLSMQIENKRDGKVKVSSVAYPGVTITISNIKYYVRDPIKYAQFVRDGADIKVNPYI